MAKKELRYFQRDAVESILDSFANDRRKRVYINLFTALGKSLVCAKLIEWATNKGGRILVLVPRSELVSQNYDEAFQYIDNKALLGRVSAKLGKDEINAKAIIATWSSLTAKRLIKLGKIDMIVIDECHYVSTDDDSQLRKVLAHIEMVNDKVFVVGMTATHYRTGEGQLHEVSIKGRPYFDGKIYDSTIDPGIGRLISEGYLAKIETLKPEIHININGIKMSGDDLSLQESGVKFGAILNQAVVDIKKKIAENGIKTAMIFCATVDNGIATVEALGSDISRCVSGRSTKTEADDALEWLKNGDGTRILVNCELYTTGFNYPALECVIMMRATVSLSLLVQIIGRLIRPHGDKIGYFVDYGTNIERLLPDGLLNIAPPPPKMKKLEAVKKDCLSCGTANLIAAKKCVSCSMIFVAAENDSGNYSMISKADLMIAEAIASETKLLVIDWWIESHKAAMSGEIMVKISYELSDGNTYYRFASIRSATIWKRNAGMAIIKEIIDKDALSTLDISSFAMTVDDIVALYNNNKYIFNSPKSAIIRPQQKNNRYNEIVRVEYGHE